MLKNWLFLVLVSVVVVSSSKSSYNNNDDDCSLYLAPSSIPNAGWGIFAGQDFRVGDRVEPPGIAIPVVWNNNNKNLPNNNDASSLSSLYQFLYRSSIAGGFESYDTTQFLLPGIGTMANYIHGRSNVVEGGVSIRSSTTTASSTTTTIGDGASTLYHDFSFVASKTIQAGEELFIGEGQLREQQQQQSHSNNHHKYWKDYPTLEGWNHVDTYIVSWLQEYHQNHPDFTEMQWMHMLQQLQTINTTLFSSTSNDVASLLPSTLDELLLLLEPQRMLSRLKKKSLFHNNYYCLDHVKEENGGATATRYLKKDTIIAPLPVLPLATSSLFIPSSSEQQQSSSPSIQLLANYCWGPQTVATELVLCPLTQAGVLINHPSKKNDPWSTSSSSSCSTPQQVANAKIRWSPAYQEQNSKLWKLSSTELLAQNYTRAPLLMELVALVDIPEGNEIVVDYSSAWEEAYERHDHPTMTTSTLKMEYFQDSSMTTPKPSSALPDTVRYECRMEAFANETLVGTKKNNDDDDDVGWNHYKQWSSLIQSANDSPFNYMVYGGNNNQFVSWYPCNVLRAKRPKEEESSSSSFLAVEVETKTSLATNKIFRQLLHFPISSLRLVPTAKSLVTHHPRAFRQYVPLIPIEWFPPSWLLSPSTSTTKKGKKNDADDEKDRSPEEVEELIRSMKCGNYFAPSNLPEAGFSQYTAVPYTQKDMIINSAIPTLVIPIDDYKKGSSSSKKSSTTMTYRDWILNEYVWSGKTYGTEYENPNSNVVLGPSLANFHPGKVNMGVKVPTWQPLLDLCDKNAYGAGAFSDYQGCAFATPSRDENFKKLQAGEELFVSYGDTWFTSRTQFQNVIPLSHHYDEANALLRTLYDVAAGVNVGVGQQQHLPSSSSLFTKLLELARDLTKHNPLTLQVLPSTVQDWMMIMKEHDGNTAQAAMKLRSLEWLEEHGKCMDHIYMNTSTIRQAGQGAFSRRHLPMGTTIISSPMIHVYNRSTMELNFTTSDEDNDEEIYKNVNPTMQLLNYQFSHPLSSVYLLPINQMTAINHYGGGRTFSSDKEEVNTNKINAKLQWATWDKKSSYYLQRPLEDLKLEPYSTMVMDVIATRDIAPDEEIFIDYGEEWESAWNDHVKNWKSPCDPKKKSSYEIYQMNHDKFNITHHTWSENHFNVCSRKDITEDDFKVVYILKDGERTTTTAQDSTSNYRGITLDDDGFRYGKEELDRKIPCKILGTNLSDQTMEVVIFFAHSQAIEVYPAMPAYNVDFIPKPFRGDMHHPQAFRQEIMIPTEIFPKHWMDLKK